jgi:hypothetical protein
MPQHLSTGLVHEPSITRHVRLPQRITLVCFGGSSATFSGSMTLKITLSCAVSCTRTMWLLAVCASHRAPPPPPPPVRAAVHTHALSVCADPTFGLLPREAHLVAADHRDSRLRAVHENVYAFHNGCLLVCANGFCAQRLLCFLQQRQEWGQVAVFLRNSGTIVRGGFVWLWVGRLPCNSCQDVAWGNPPCSH